VGDTVSELMGGSTKKALRKQSRLQAQREAEVEAAAAGQRRARGSAGRGLIAYMDDALKTSFGG
jgi:hypothetical protein